MATADFTRDLRRAVITALKADTTLIAIVPAARIYPSTVPASPTFPFIRWDAPNNIPRGHGCTQGADISFFVHNFAKPRMSGAQVAETAESYCERITALMAKALHRERLALTNATARVRVRSTRVMMDGDERDAFHGLLDCIAAVTIT
ncbi:tail completion protein gp17 [Sphingosinicella xenopeptidilytica]|uniref:DUF3168 domain-containing protein n=1 Tax=Sphingosinicella xenopeptidilytica TaxID=364098 RepID=A0ABW3C1W8_SPHXN